MGAPFTSHEASHPESAEHALKSPEHSGPCQLSLKDWMEGSKSLSAHGQDSNATAALHSMGLQDFHITHGGAEAAESAPPSGSPPESMQIQSLARSEGAGAPPSNDRLPAYDTGAENWVSASSVSGDVIANKTVEPDVKKFDDVPPQGSQWQAGNGLEKMNDTPPSGDATDGARSPKPSTVGKGAAHETTAAIPSAVTYDADGGRFHVHY